MSLSDLKPCPFCGCDGWIVEDRSALPLLYRPQCKMCGASLGGFTYRDNAIMVWNARAEGVAALQQAGEPVAWRSIETAPTDEDEPWGGTFIAYAPHSMGGYCLIAARNTEGLVVDTMEGTSHPFTHWRPLSEPPSPRSPLPQQTALVEGRGGDSSADLSSASRSQTPRSDGGEG